MEFEHNFKEYPELRNDELAVWELKSPFPQIKEDFWAECVKVHDGDTITLHTNFRGFNFPLRIAFIDTKEMNEGGAEARDWLKGQIEGEDVFIKINPKNRVEKYGRLLGSVINKGMDMGDAMMRMGLAVPFARRREDQLPSIYKMFEVKKWF